LTISYAPVFGLTGTPGEQDLFAFKQDDAFALLLLSIIGAAGCHTAGIAPSEDGAAAEQEKYGDENSLAVLGQGKSAAESAGRFGMELPDLSHEESQGTTRSARIFGARGDVETKTSSSGIGKGNAGTPESAVSALPGKPLSAPADGEVVLHEAAPLRDGQVVSASGTDGGTKAKPGGLEAEGKTGAAGAAGKLPARTEYSEKTGSAAGADALEARNARPDGQKRVASEFPTGDHVSREIISGLKDDKGGRQTPVPATGAFLKYDAEVKTEKLKAAAVARSLPAEQRLSGRLTVSIEPQGTGKIEVTAALRGSNLSLQMFAASPAAAGIANSVVPAVAAALKSEWGHVPIAVRTGANGSHQKAFKKAEKVLSIFC